MFGRAFEPPPPEIRGSFRMALFLFVVFFVPFGVGAYHAMAHNGYDHYRNPQTNISCCDQRDCAPLSADDVEARIREVPEGVLVDGRLFPKDQLQEGPDGRWHVCEHPEHKTLFCVLLPRPSF